MASTPPWSSSEAPSARSGRPSAGAWLRGGLALAYPFLIFGGLAVLEPRQVALLAAALLGLRWVARWRSPSREDVRRVAVAGLTVAALLAATVAWNDEHALLLVPAAVNAALLAVFARSLLRGPPFVETLARMQVPDLPEDEIRYCRTVTAVWCGFFLANGAACAWLAFAGPMWAWTVYTGFASYLLVGLLFAAEFTLRSWRFGRYGGTLIEPLFRRLFRPPR